MAHAPGSSSRVLDAVAISLAVGICVGLVVLWPSDVDPPKAAEALRAGQLVEASVESIEVVTCGTTAGGGGEAPPTAPGGPSCRRITFVVEEGRDAGSTTAIELPEVSTAPDLGPGERVILERPPVEIPGMPYAFYDRIRTPSLLWLAVIFAVLVVLLGRMRGFAALVGLAASRRSGPFATNSIAARRPCLLNWWM